MPSKSRTHLDLLTPEEIAAECRVRTQTVLNWIHAGRLASIRLSPRVIRVPRAAYDVFVNGVHETDDAHVESERASSSPNSPDPAGDTQPRARGFFDSPPSIQELAREQGVEPVRNLDDLKGDFWPAADDVDAFLAFVRPRPPARRVRGAGLSA